MWCARQCKVDLKPTAYYAMCYGCLEIGKKREIKVTIEQTLGFTT